MIAYPIGDFELKRALSEIERLQDERDHWKGVARSLIRAYQVDDQAYDPEKETDRLLELVSKKGP